MYYLLLLDEAKRLLKIPVFTEDTEIRVILEYHELGQIWILDNQEKGLVNYYLDLVIKFSVDIFIVNIKDNFENKSILPSDKLINNKYSFSNYQTSRFYGFNLFVNCFEKPPLPDDLDDCLSIITVFFP